MTWSYSENPVFGSLRFNNTAPVRILNRYRRHLAIEIPYPLQLSAALAVTILAATVAGAQDFTQTPGASCGTAPGCVTSYHNDNARDGVNGYETTLTPSIVSGSTFTLLKNFDNLDGLVYAQPLYLTGVTMASTNCTGVKDIAIVATENNTIYVYDVTPGDTIQECYHKNVNGSGENAIPFTDLSGSTPQCNNLIPQQGITGTPAIDIAVTPPALYFVSAVKTASSTYDFKLNVMLPREQELKER